MMTPFFQLDVLQNERSCIFCLSWGEGERRFATVPYPVDLMQAYQNWQRVYLQFYRSKRGRKEASGIVPNGSPSLDSWLEEKRAILLDQFNLWLRDGALTEIREAIAQAKLARHSQQSPMAIDLLVACQPLELARLPWEQWSLVASSAPDTRRLRVLRTRINSSQSNPLLPLPKRQKIRILVIIGTDDPAGINFQQDFEAIQQQLSKGADVHPVGWTPGQDVVALKKQIAVAIADPVGWDVLFFAGHSNETKLTGGELAIAPNASLHLSEIQLELESAIRRGLQFAFFNSCSGLNIADALIDLGLNQVAVMREPIANTVAQKLLLQFLAHLAQYQDVQDALQAACQYLQTSAARFDFPSAYLVPSLYCQPQATLFQMQRPGWQRLWELWRPTLSEAIAITSIVGLTLTLAIPRITNPEELKSPLLEQRIWLQAVYRDFTHQNPNNDPPILLVDIDEPTVINERIQIEPIDRRYLAQIIRRLTELDAKVVGLDYVLDGSQIGDEELAQAVRQAIQKNQTWFVFAAEEREGKSINPQIASPEWSLSALMNAYPQYMRLPDQQADCHIPKLAHLIALIQQINQSTVPDQPQPELQSQTDLCKQVFQFIQQSPSQNETLSFLYQIQTPSVLNFLQYLPPSPADLWLTPIKDFSISPDHVYQRISARDLLDKSLDATLRKQGIEQKIILIAGSYWGGIGKHKDNFDVPAAIAYRTQAHQWFIGAESHAYGIHHFLVRHLIVPIPDLWMVGIAIILGKGMSVFLYPRLQHKRRIVIIGTGVGILGYVSISFQLYIMGAILMPCCLPIAAYVTYLLPTVTKKL